MEIRLFKTFLLVAKLLNITKAAEQLSFSQPAITAQISSLEDAFHVQLFKRNGKRLALTEAGQKMVEYAESFISLYEEAQNAMESFGRQDASLRLGVSTQMINYFLPHIIMELQGQMPQLHVNVEVCMNTQEVVRGVQERRYDFGFIHGKNTLAQICEHGIWSDDVLWVASADFIAQKGPVEDIRKCPLINYSEGSVFRAKLERHIHSSEFHSAVEYSDSEAIKRAVIGGLGISYLPRTLVQDEVNRGMLVLLEQGPTLQLRISLIHRRDKVFSVPMYALLLLLSNQPGADSSIGELMFDPPDRFHQKCE